MSLSAHQSCSSRSDLCSPAPKLTHWKGAGEVTVPLYLAQLFYRKHTMDNRIGPGENAHARQVMRAAVEVNHIKEGEEMLGWGWGVAGAMEDGGEVPRSAHLS